MLPYEIFINVEEQKDGALCLRLEDGRVGACVRLSSHSPSFYVGGAVQDELIYIRCFLHDSWRSSNK